MNTGHSAGVSYLGRPYFELGSAFEKYGARVNVLWAQPNTVHEKFLARPGISTLDRLWNGSWFRRRPFHVPNQMNKLLSSILLAVWPKWIFFSFGI